MTRRRVAIAAAAAMALGVLGAGGGWWLGRDTHRADAAARTVPTATAAVVTTDLATTTQVSGTLGYAGSYPVLAQGGGVAVSALPTPGQVITRGQRVYELDGAPVTLFYGARPCWRTLAADVTDGPDVLQLEQNLTALGYADASNLTVDAHFTWATQAAIRRWQQATGQLVTGQLSLGAVLYEPSPIRIAAVSAALGQPLRAGDPILRATSTTAVVALPIPTAQTYLIHVGDAVTVTLPSGTVTPGSVQAISAAATAVSAGNGGGSQSGPTQATVAATVTLTDPTAVSNLDQAPVTVNVTSRAVKNVLAVPITALVALAGGGYGVYVTSGTSRQLVTVTPGLFATTLVQVTSPGLHAGDRVAVPTG